MLYLVPKLTGASVSSIAVNEGATNYPWVSVNLMPISKVY